MYMIERVEKKNMEEGTIFRSSALMFKIPISLIEQADFCEIWGTSFKDEGDDYCEYRFFKDGKSIGIEKINGY